MAITLFADAYEHDPAPEVIIEKSPILETDGGVIIGEHQTWRVNGTLIADGVAAIQAKVVLLEAAYASVDKLQLKSGVDVLQEMDGTADGARDGIIITMLPSYPIGAGSGQYATQRKYSLVAEIDTYDGNELGDPDILSYEVVVTYSYDQHDKETRSVRGTLRTKDGVSALGKWAAVDAEWHEIAGYNRMSYSKETNKDDDEMSFSMVDVKYWHVWPVNVTGGSATTTKTLDASGVMRVTVSGTFTGTGAQVAADGLKLALPQYLPTNEQQTVDEFTGSVSFTYSYVDTVDSETDYLSFSETTQVEYSLQDFVIHPVLGGGVPVRQDTVVRPARATQNGSAIGRDDYPAVPPVLFDITALKRKHESQTGPDYLPGGSQTNFRVSWAYSYEFAEDPVFVSPHSLHAGGPASP